MARKNKTKSFMEGFQIGQTLANAYQGASQKAEIGAIMEAKPEMSEGFTADDGAQLEAIANAKDADGKPYYQMSSGEDGKSYQVQANFQAADGTEHAPATVAPQQVTDFMGQRSSGALSDDQVSRMKYNAVSDVVARNDPIAGMRMRRETERDARDDQRFGWEKSRSEREERTATQTENDANAKRGLDKDVGDWMSGRLTGADGVKRAATVDDHLAATQYKAQKQIESGNTDGAAQSFKEFQANSFVKIQLEGAERDQALGKTVAAVNAGDFDAAKDFYNKYMPDGSNVSNITRGQNGEIIIDRDSLDGRKLPPTTMKDASQFTAALATFKDPMALYNYTQREFMNNMALRGEARADRADVRAGNADARAGASAARENADRIEKRDAGMALYTENNPNATPTQQRAVRAGVLPAVAKKGDYKTEAGDITSLLGTPAVDEKGNAITDVMTGRQVVNRNPDREKAFFKFQKDNGITDTNEGLQKFLTSEGGGKAPPAAPPKKGDKVGGFEFLGGNPNDKKSWRQVSSGTVK